MSEYLFRAVAADLSLDGRTIVGLAVPFDRVANVTDNGRTRYNEGFRRGAFARTIAERGNRVRAAVNHDEHTRLPIGRAVHLAERVDGLEAHLRVSDTAQGNDVLALVRDGVLSGLSIGFKPVRQVVERGVTWRTEAALREVSVCPDGQYDDARISAVRGSATAPLSVELAQLRLDLILKAW